MNWLLNSRDHSRERVKRDFIINRISENLEAYLGSCQISLTHPAITCSKLTIETLEQGVFIVNFEHISDLVLVFLLLTLSR